MFAISVPTFAAGNAAVAVTSADQVKRGEEIVFTVTLSDCEAFKSMALTPSYDKEIFDFVSAEWLLKDTLIAKFDGKNAAMAFDKAQTVNGGIFKLVLKVKADAAVGNTTVAATPVIKNDSTVIEATLSSKTVEICCKEHTYEGDGWVVKTEPTCTTDGEKERTCTTCKKVETEKLAALGHKFGEWKTAKAATCTAKGTQERTCSVCKAVETKETKALGHKFESPVVVKEATLSSEGLKEGKCKVCGKTTSQSIPCTAKDEKTGIIVEAEEGVFTEGTTTDFSEIVSTDAKYPDVQNALAEKSGKFNAYNIAFKNNGAAVTPNGKYTLTIPAEGFEKANLAVYFIGADNTAADVEFKANSNGTVTFETSDTGIFVVADKSVEGSKAEVKDEPESDKEVEPVVDDVEEEEESGSNLIWIIIALLAVVAIAVIIIIVVLKKKR